MEMDKLWKRKIKINNKQLHNNRMLKNRNNYNNNKLILKSKFLPIFRK